MEKISEGLRSILRQNLSAYATVLFANCEQSVVERDDGDWIRVNLHLRGSEDFRFESRAFYSRSALQHLILNWRRWRDALRLSDDSNIPSTVSSDLNVELHFQENSAQDFFELSKQVLSPTSPVNSYDPDLENALRQLRG